MSETTTNDAPATAIRRIPSRPVRYPANALAMANVSGLGISRVEMYGCSATIKGTSTQNMKNTTHSQRALCADTYRNARM